jgi:hypothetical protein
VRDVYAVEGGHDMVVVWIIGRKSERRRRRSNIVSAAEPSNEKLEA